MQKKTTFFVIRKTPMMNHTCRKCENVTWTITPTYSSLCLKSIYNDKDIPESLNPWLGIGPTKATGESRLESNLGPDICQPTPNFNLSHTENMNWSSRHQKKKNAEVLCLKTAVKTIKQAWNQKAWHEEQWKFSMLSWQSRFGPTLTNPSKFCEKDS